MNIEIPPLPENKGFLVVTHNKNCTKVLHKQVYETFDLAFHNKYTWYDNQKRYKYAKINILLITPNDDQIPWAGEFIAAPEDSYE